MRWLSITLVSLGLSLLSIAPAEARREIVTVVDPVTGLASRQFVRSTGFYGNGLYQPYTYGIRNAYGAPIIARRGFPLDPVDRQRVWRAGRKWQFEAALGQWIIIR